MRATSAVLTTLWNAFAPHRSGEAPPDIIWHFAANSDIAAGAVDASIDFKRTLQTTFAILEGAKSEGVKRIAFASSSAIYGELDESAGRKFRSIAADLELRRDQACQRGAC